MITDYNLASELSVSECCTSVLTRRRWQLTEDGCMKGLYVQRVQIVNMKILKSLSWISGI